MRWLLALLLAWPGFVWADQMYDEGTTDTTITGRAILGENADTLRPIKVDAAGELQVDVLSGGGGATHTDDAAFTPAIDDGAPAFACADETTPDSVDEGDAGCVRMSLNRNLYTVLRDAAGNERGANVDASNRLLTFSDVNSFPDNEPFNLNQWGGTGTTLGQKTMAASVPVVVASDQSSLAVAVDETSFGVDELPAAAALADNTANPTTTLIGSLLHAFDGTTWDRVTNGGGTEATALRVTVANDSTGLLSVDDNGGALTVDWAGTAPPIGAGTEAAALRVTVATDSTGVLSVDDNGSTLSVDDGAGSLTVDGTVSVSGAVDTELTTADLDPGIGTDTQAVVGVSIAKSGGSARVGAGADGDPVPVSDDGGSLTVDDGGIDLNVEVTETSFEATQATATSLKTQIFGDDTTQAVDTDVAGQLQVDVLTLPSVTIGTFPDNEPVNVAQWGGIAVLGGAGVVGAGAPRVTLATDDELNDDADSIRISSELIDDSILADNAGFTDGTTKLSMAGFIFDEVAGTALTENDAAAARLDSKRALVGVIEDAITRGLRASVRDLAVNDALNVAIVDASGVQITSFGVSKAEDEAHISGDTGTPAWAVANEANTARAADGDYIPLATDTEGNVRTVGNRDHDAVDAGEPVKVGMKAIAHGANPTAVAAGDRTDWYANRAGIPFVLGGHPNILTLRANYTAAQTNTAIVAAPGLGNKLVVTRVSVLADNANTVDVQVRIGFAASVTPTTTGVVLTHPGVAPGSGVIEGDGSGILGVGADNDALLITSEVPTTGSIDVVVSYFSIES